ncbi:MAG: hypothetical protein MPJ78_16250 [Hyphomicrobiaceae bacterium]|nr:hypothetical protein [Hyphomicrobiaceae bacterium]
MGGTAKLPRLVRACALGTALAMAGLVGGADAQIHGPMLGKLPYSPIPGRHQPVGLWDKPNQACTDYCQVHVDKGCFKRLSDKYPDADAASIQEQCEDKFSLCLYKCMCDTCDENQIIIRQ